MIMQVEQVLSKKDLLAAAKELGIKGRHEMKTSELEKAVRAAQKPSKTKSNIDQILPTKTRRVSPHERDEKGRVVRAGKNLSGNVPFREKYYYLDSKVSAEKDWTPEYKELEAKAPMQVRLILKSMRKAKTTRFDSAKRGGMIVQRAIDDGLLATKIPAENLFAYYRRVLESLGVIHAVGFDGEEEGDEDEGEE